MERAREKKKGRDREREKNGVGGAQRGQVRRVKGAPNTMAHNQ